MPNSAFWIRNLFKGENIKMAHPSLMNQKNKIDIIKHRWFWIAFSILLILPGIIALGYSIATYDNHTPLKVGIDFTGGTILQYGVNEDVTIKKMDSLRDDLVRIGIKQPVIQNIGNKSLNASEKTDGDNLISIKTSFIDETDTDTVNKITSVITKDFSDAHLNQVTSVGPTLGKELLKNSLTALLFAFLGICIYVSVRFQFDYAVAVFLSLFFDTTFVIGCFSLFSLFFNFQVDALFLTAILTVIGSSVHDTIVVFDRIRENNRFLAKKFSFNEIVNASVNQTLARSINTSLTTLITLLALYFFGGATTKYFVLAMILGIAVGTYSSIFLASTIFALWHEKHDKAAI